LSSDELEFGSVAFGHSMHGEVAKVNSRLNRRNGTVSREHALTDPDGTSEHGVAAHQIDWLIACGEVYSVQSRHE
jgi:hypothetical protein